MPQESSDVINKTSWASGPFDDGAPSHGTKLAVMLKVLTQRRISDCLFLSRSTRSAFPIRTMATGKKENEELKASKLFSVSGFSSVVTGGGTGIGLSMSIPRYDST